MIKHPRISAVTLVIYLSLFSPVVNAFTLINVPSNVITESSTLAAHVRPIASAINKQVRYNSLGVKSMIRQSANGTLLAANTYASNSVFASLGGGASAYSVSRGIWLNSIYTNFSENYALTEFDGDSNLLLGGYDYTFDEKYLLGLAISYEQSQYSTRFNSGMQNNTGFGFSPYFAYLISDAWSIDVSLGYSQFDTDQYRSVAVAGPVINIFDSDFSSQRSFSSVNLNSSTIRNKWNISTWLGYLTATNKQDGYRESGGTSFGSLKAKLKQFNLGAEAGYSVGDSEAYLGLLYEKVDDLDQSLVLTEADDDNFVLSLGWRYYGRGISTNFDFSSVLGKDNYDENSLFMTLRLDL